MATDLSCSFTSTCGFLQTPYVLSLHNIAPTSEASDLFGLSPSRENLLYIAAIRTCGRNVSPGAWRQKYKLRGQLLVGADIPGPGGRVFCATRKFFPRLLANSPVACRRLRPSP